MTDAIAIRPTVIQVPILTTNLNDFMTPGIMVEIDALEAERIGLIVEDAVSFGDAWNANGDPHSLKQL